jgi:hypothetical protein
MTQPTAGLGFLPWLRTGLAGEIDRQDGDPATAPRAGVDVTVTVDAAGDERPVQVTLPLFGPGDVAGLDARAIIRVAPKPGELDAEPNEFPLVEFAEPDLPWRYTPAVANAASRVRPWLVLAVLRADEITAEGTADADGRLPAITVAAASALPRLDQSWAWAHVQVDAFDPATESVSTADRRRIRARVIAPRHLAPKTAYAAVLVPAFERGRLAGLREPVLDSVDGMAAAWAPDATNIRLPVYYRWTFQTGEQADFEQLARRLTPRPADSPIGTYPMDVATPDPALPAAASAPLQFSGALLSPTAAPGGWPAAERDAFVPKLAAMLNQPDDALTQDTDAEPIVAPPLWGRWHAATARLDPAPLATPQWFHEVNADPRLRATAGLGAEVIRRNDDELMAEAWAQVEGVLAANEALRRAQAARETSGKLLTNHFGAFDEDTLLRVAAPVHSRVIVPGSTTTAAEHLRQSPIPDGATDGRVRRAQRPIARRSAQVAARLRPTTTGSSSDVTQPIAPSSPAPTPSNGALLDRLNRQDLQTRPPVPRPPGMVVTTLTVKPVHGVGGVVTGGVHTLAAEPVSEEPAAAVHDSDATALIAPSPPPGGPTGPAGPIHTGPGTQPVPPPAVGWLPGVAGGVLGNSSAFNTPVPITTDPRDSAAVAHTATLFGQAMTALISTADTPPNPGPVLRPANLTTLAGTLTTALDPAKTIVDGIRGRLRLAPWITWNATDPLDAIMAAPEFDTPMYEPLRDLGQDWMLPGASSILPDTVTVVLPNQRFIESYLLGLSFEMGRELLFHEYPTDQRGTYFPQFWDTRGALSPDDTPVDPKMLHDITAIHTWHADAGLGANTGRVPAPPDGHLVLLVKGELFRRFPNTLVSAVQAVMRSDGTRTLGVAKQYPIFSGRLEPDIAFFGFDLTIDRARGGGADLGWFFVLAEHPTEPRFGLDADDGDYAGRAASWPDLNWADLAPTADALTGLDYVDLGAPLPDVSAVAPAPGDPAVNWHTVSGANGSDLAWITLRRPFRVAIHADDVLRKTS